MHTVSNIGRKYASYKDIATLWERLGELKEMQKKMQKKKGMQQESAKPKTNEMATGDLLEIREGILVICDDIQEEENTGEVEDEGMDVCYWM